ncbi:putative glycoprotein 3-alpha-L-fucosyltransferase [Dinochytrium kinnereticum]|nr:putative glycoprotein 3-alpha-L-fucosyltransferase [Dinochytrium kinnereticum]
MIHSTRRCELSCAFVATDLKHSEPFTQHQFDHLWLSKSDLVSFNDAAHAKLYPSQPLSAHASSSIMPSSRDKIRVTMMLKPPKVTYEHPNDATYMSESVTIPFDTGMICGGRNFLRLPDGNTSFHTPEVCNQDRPQHHGDIEVGFSGRSDVPINLIDRVYSDFFDFASIVRETQMSGRSYYKRIRGMIAFTPPCSRLHPGAINFLTKLRAQMSLHIYGSCLATHTLENGKKLNENQKVRMTTRYLFHLVWEEHADVEGYVSENFFKSLAYSSVPVIWGPRDLERFIPANNSHFSIRGTETSPDRLVRQLQNTARNSTQWLDMMSWRNAKTGSELRGEFLRLWEWTATRSVCRVCEEVAKRVGGDAAFRAPLVEDRSGLQELIRLHALLETRMTNNEGKGGANKTGVVEEAVGGG